MLETKSCLKLNFISQCDISKLNSYLDCSVLLAHSDSNLDSYQSDCQTD